MARPLTPQDLAGSRPHWLVDITGPNEGQDTGKIYRFSDTNITINDAEGEFVYAAGLSDISLSYSLDEASPQTLQIELLSDVDWVAEFAALGMPWGASVTVRRWYEGRDRASAPVVIQGTITELSYGELGEVMTFTVEQSPWEGADLIPDPTQSVTEDTWSNPHSGSLGLSYPIVFGQPGIYIDSAGTTQKQEAAYGVQAQVSGANVEVIIAGHKIQAGTIRLYDGTNDAAFTVNEQLDDAGNLVSYVSGTSGSVTCLAGGTYYWSMENITDNTFVDRNGGTVTGAGHAVAALMSFVESMPVNQARCESERAYLDHIKVHFFINTPTTAYEFIQSNLANILPISFAQDFAGVYWRAWRDLANDTDVVGEISVDRGEARRDGPISFSSANDVYNRFVLRFNENAVDASNVTTVELSGDTDDGYESWLCKYSQDRFGVRTWEVATNVIQDRGSAYAIAKAQARRRALPRRSVTYTGDLLLERFEVGDVIRLYDDGSGFKGVLAIVDGVSLSLDAVSLTLMILDRPAQFERSTQ